MTTPTVSVQVSESLYQRLQRLAHLTNRPVEALIEQTLQAGIPPLPDTLSPEMRDDLLALEALDDDALWQVAQSVVSPDQQAQLSHLLEKNKVAPLTTTEEAELTTLQTQADQLMLRKAYAFVLLRWRGHRLPGLAELEARA
jgi:hypothetical protein